MAKLIHPLLCWQLDADTVFGMLLGTGYQAVERSARRIAATSRGRLLLRIIAMCFDNHLDSTQAPAARPRYSRVI